MPPLPDEAARILTERFGVKRENAVMLTGSVFVTAYFTACAEACRNEGERTLFPDFVCFASRPAAGLPDKGGNGGRPVL